MHRSIGGRVSLFGAIRHEARPWCRAGPMELSQRQPVSCVPLVSSVQNYSRCRKDRNRWVNAGHGPDHSAPKHPDSGWSFRSDQCRPVRQQGVVRPLEAPDMHRIPRSGQVSAVRRGRVRERWKRLRVCGGPWHRGRWGCARRSGERCADLAPTRTTGRWCPPVSC